MAQVRFGTDKDVKKYIRRAQKQGWTVECNGDQHIRVQPLGAPSFVIPMTPGSKSRVRQSLRQFRKSGLQ